MSDLGGGGGGFQCSIPKDVNDYPGIYINQCAVSYMDSSVTSQTNSGTNSTGTLHSYNIIIKYLGHF